MNLIPWLFIACLSCFIFLLGYYENNSPYKAGGTRSRFAYKIKYAICRDKRCGRCAFRSRVPVYLDCIEAEALCVYVDHGHQCLRKTLNCIKNTIDDLV